MWLLDTARAVLKFFPTPESVPGGYAILSHVWEADEQTFQDLQAIRARCIEDGTNPRDLVCDKIRQFCILAERSGHEWGWADMCCIDKTSSIELSEAITSMYRYYSLADVCFAYLRDVPTASQDDLRAYWSAFRESRWHTRGWTLQELIAPPLVVFVSNTWKPLGAKADLADLLEEITLVPTEVLQLEDKPSSYCVAARMSWAADRKTTRPEDEAYCLMGIFGIFMPPLYGEGRNAFLRLQEEIMRQVDDPSIFAWGRLFRSLSPDIGWVFDSQPGREDDPLFAQSPSDFRDGHRIVQRRAERPRPYNPLLKILIRWNFLADLSKVPTFNITPYGIKAHLPIFASSKHHLVVALLLGITPLWPGGTTQSVGLLLRQVESPDHTRSLYVPCSYHRRQLTLRLMAIEGDPLEISLRKNVKLQWRTIYIVRNPPTWTDPHELRVVGGGLHAPFYIPRSEMSCLLRFQGVISTSLQPPNPTNISWRRYVALEVCMSSDSDLFFCTSKVVIYLGLCTKAPQGQPKHWAMIVEYGHSGVDEPEEQVEHICAENHVDERPRQIHPLTIYNSDRTGSQFRNPFSPKTTVSLELSFQPYPVGLRHCHKVCIRINSTEDNDELEDGGQETPRLECGDPLEEQD